MAIVSLYLGHALVTAPGAAAAPSRPVATAIESTAPLETGTPLLAWSYPSCGVDLGCWADVTWQLIAGVADSFWSYVTGLYNQVLNIGSTLWNAVGQPIVSWLAGRWDSFKATFIDPFWATMTAWFGDRFGELGTVFDTLFGDVWPTVTQWFADRFDELETVFNALFGNVWPTITAWFADRINAVRDAVDYLATEIWPQLQAWFFDRLLSIGEWLQDLSDAIGGFFQSTWDALGDLWASAQDFYQGLVDAWWDLWNAGVTSFQGWLTLLRDGLVMLLEELLRLLFEPDPAKLNELASVWGDQMEHGAPGLLSAAAHVPGDSLAAVEVGVGAPCPSALVITAGNFSLCGAIITATSAGAWSAVRVLLGAGLILLVCVAMVRRIGDVING